VSFRTIRYETRAVEGGAVATVTLDVPAKRNAIGPEMANELLHALAKAADDPEVRALVLTGAGGHFCAGGNIGQMSGEGEALDFKGDYADLLLAMVRSPKPIVAKVRGTAMGGGLGLVAASHFALSADDAEDCHAVRMPAGSSLYVETSVSLVARLFRASGVEIGRWTLRSASWDGPLAGSARLDPAAIGVLRDLAADDYLLCVSERGDSPTRPSPVDYTLAIGVLPPSR